MEVIGRVKMIDTTKEVGSAGFKKRDIVVTTDEQYPQQILVQFVQDKCDLLNNYVVGDNVKIDINLRGREWTNPQGEAVYFNTIQGWRIGKEQAENAGTQPQQPPMPTAAPFAPASDFKEEDHDDLPF
jgi:single-stranded DNA-binding protein